MYQFGHFDRLTPIHILNKKQTPNPQPQISNQNWGLTISLPNHVALHQTQPYLPKHSST